MSAAFRGRHFAPDIILLCMRWYCRYALSYRDLEEMMVERGLSVDHTNRVELRGFGAFTVRNRDARPGRNPRTGEAVEVEQKQVPFFKPGKELRQRINATSVR